MTVSLDPSRMNRRTSAALGRSLSRFGPTTPLAPAALSVWHAPHVSRNLSLVLVAAAWLGGGSGCVGRTWSVGLRVTVLSFPPPQPATATQAATTRSTRE